MKASSIIKGWTPWVMGAAAAALTLAGACASGPESKKTSPIAGAMLATQADADPFAACVKPFVVSVARDEDAPETAVLEGLEAASPADVEAFRAKAEGCGAWVAGKHLAPHVAGVLAYGRCHGGSPDGGDDAAAGGTTCPKDWPQKLASALREAPVGVVVEPGSQCKAPDPDQKDWAKWGIARLLEADASMSDATWLERVEALDKAYLLTLDEAVFARFDREDGAGQARIARLVLARINRPSERLRFRGAEIFLANGDRAEAERWFDQLATTGRTAWRAFAKAELDKLKQP